MCMQENIEKQKAAISKMAAMDLPEVAGFEMLKEQMKLQKLDKESGSFGMSFRRRKRAKFVEIRWRIKTYSGIMNKTIIRED